MEHDFSKDLDAFGRERRCLLLLAALSLIGAGLGDPARAADRLQETIDRELDQMRSHLQRNSAQQVLQEMAGYEDFHFNIPAERYFQRFAYRLYQKDIEAAERKPALVLFYDSSGLIPSDTVAAVVFRVLATIYQNNILALAANLTVHPQKLIGVLDGKRFGLPDITGTPSLALFTASGGTVRHYDTTRVAASISTELSGSLREKVEKWINPALFPHLKVFTYRGKNYPIGQPHLYRNGSDLSAR